MFLLTFLVRCATINALANPGIWAIVLVIPNSVPENGPAAKSKVKVEFLLFQIQTTIVKTKH